MTEQIPAIGRAVHYHNDPKDPEVEHLMMWARSSEKPQELVTHAATILGDGIGEGRVYLEIKRGVYGSGGLMFVQEPPFLSGHEIGVPYSETPKHGHWSWPPRV